MKTIQFPTLEDRINIHNFINHYAKGKCSRNDMMRWIAHIIQKYKVERVPIFGYSVRILQYYIDLPIISIEGAEVTDTCPGCGAGTSATRYLRTEQENLHKDHDIISLTCLECGCVFMCKASKKLEQKQNGPLVLQSQTDREEVFNNSIAQKVTLLEMVCDADYAALNGDFAYVRELFKVGDLCEVPLWPKSIWKAEQSSWEES